MGWGGDGVGNRVGGESAAVVVAAGERRGVWDGQGGPQVSAGERQTL